jgi:hypothetical protein
VNKQHSVKVAIKNITTTPQRVTVLCKTQSPYFIVTNKSKGMLGSGMCSYVQVQFTPCAGAEQQVYYYDSFKVRVGNTCLVVPIHAYPLMRCTVPSTLEFGAKCQIGSVYRKSIKLQNTSHVAFEYKMEILKPHPDFTFVSDLHGTINPG